MAKESGFSRAPTDRQSRRGTARALLAGLHARQPTVAFSGRKERVVKHTVEVDGPRAALEATGYLSQEAGEALSELMKDLTRMGVVEVELDISRCSPICMRGLERLLHAKFDLACAGVQMTFGQSTPMLSKVFGLMGLRPDGEPQIVDTDASCD